MLSKLFFSQKAGVTVTGLGTLSPEMGASVALSGTSVDTCEDMDVTEDMEDIVLMADKSHSYMSPEMARWATIVTGKPQFSKPLDGEDDLRLSNMNFFKVSDLKLKKTLYRDWETDRKSTRLNSSHRSLSRMPSSA